MSTPTVNDSHRLATRRPAKRPSRVRFRRYVPPQHGAWAMLAVPYLAGLVVAGYQWPDLPLFIGWLAAYLLSYFVFQAIKSRRPARYRPQVLLYASIAVPMVVLVVAARPAVLWYAPAYAILFAVNSWYAARRRERALMNDLASVVQSCLILVVVAAVAAIPASDVWPAFLLCLAYFAGTVPYVKSMIRERDNPAYRRWSIGYHVLAFVVAVLINPWAGAVFAWLLLRAVVVPPRGWSPKHVGMIEIANCLLLLACIAVL